MGPMAALSLLALSLLAFLLLEAAVDDFEFDHLLMRIRSAARRDELDKPQGDGLACARQ
jgi:hypothetical protein